MTRPNSPKAPGYLPSHSRVQFRARRTDLERADAIEQAVHTARAELARAQDARDAGAQLEHLTAAIVQLVDAQATAVAQLRADSVPWTRIGDALGLTKQAAQSRFGKSS
ncbi:hypothetical protein [Nocardioides sp. LML1-1-1.1]|uniref:hypothetical protein n=1 Tax=Nocardioides sp. LML1-1-1.1 TaxID=3135248 RepID=UPI00341C64F7